MSTLIQNYHLHDVCKNTKEGRKYTHFVATSTTKFERFYISQDLISHKIMPGIVATTFTYHSVVLLLTHMPTTVQLG